MEALSNIDMTGVDLSRLTFEEQAELERLLSDYVEQKSTTLDIMPFDEFCYTYFPRYFNIPIPEFRMDTIDFLNDNSGTIKKFATVEPRSHGKSTTYCLAYIIYALTFGLKNFIVYFAARKEEARGWLGNIRMEFENNERLLEDFPWMTKEVSVETGQTTSWNDNHLFFKTGQRVTCKGWFNSTRGLNHYGKRPDLIIIDDAENESMVSNPFIRERFLQYYTQAVGNLGGNEGCDTFIVGTLLHPESFLSKAVDPDGPQIFSEYRKTFHRAVINWDEETVLWPEAWSFERLMEQQAEIGEAAFQQEFQGVPARLFQCLFTEDKIKTFKRAETENLHDRAGWLRFLYVDPSMGKTNGDFSSLCVAYLNPKNERHIVDWITKRLTPDELGETILKLHRKHQLNAIGFETNATQGVFVHMYKKEFASKGIKLPWNEIVHSLPKKNRIDALEPSINSGRILFHPEWRSNPDYALGMRQLFNYDGRSVGDHDDGPDALAGVNELINMKRGKRKGKWTNVGE